MGGIYQGSALTLYAQAGDHENAGLACSRDPCWVKPCEVTLVASIDDCIVEGKTSVTFMLPSYIMGPLDQRGWALQEELLARRALYFGALQIEWRCQHSVAGEGQPQPGAFQTTIGGRFYTMIRDYLDFDTDTPETIGQFQESFYNTWYIMVENYCSRSLTFQTDVLPALAGLARTFATTQKIDYSNGLWIQDLKRGLLWYVWKEATHSVSSDE